MKEIVQQPAKVLREKSQPVNDNEFGSKELNLIVENMKEALAAEDDGVAIAAPQIGILKRIFVVSHKLFQNRNDDREPIPPILTTAADKIFINPALAKTSKQTEDMEEGCLSVRPLYGYVTRHSKARVRAQDTEGNFFELGGSGLLAQVFQHEIDHLDGTLFIDKARDIHNPFKDDDSS